MLHIFLGNYPGKIRYGTSGVPIPGYEARLIDEQGREVAEGEIGELSVRGPRAADGYWNQREKTRRTFEGEWTRTGDKYVREPDGFYRICGRTDDMFKVERPMGLAVRGRVGADHASARARMRDRAEGRTPTDC